MKITAKILHLPPYISTSWQQVRAVYLNEAALVIALFQGDSITIPGLTKEILDQVFEAYASHLEEQQTKQNTTQELPASFQLFQVTKPQGMILPTANGDNPSMVRFNLDSMESISSAMQHNLAQANMPDLPQEILNKIAAVAKAVAPDDIQNMPQAEPHCNCVHCQIARAIHQSGETPAAIPTTPQQLNHEEEIISDKELAFQQWDILQTGDKLYAVTNRLDTQERYSVYLGHPVGCTCGKQGCEHILAVLKS